MKNEKSIYDELGEERKKLQEEGLLPKWVTTLAWQMLKENYLTPEYPDLKSVYSRVSKHAAKYTTNPKEWEYKFFNLFWNGWLAASTPVLSNMGTGFGCPVSCSGGVIDDSVLGFYDAQKEAAILSKNGFGTSGYLGKIRERGAKINGMKGSASGVLPVFKDFVQVSRDISQGSQRRGAWAGYIEIDHPDFFELVNFINKTPDDANIGWCVSDNFIERLNNGDKDAIERFQKSLKLKMITGKGYYFFTDKVNRQNPQMYKDKNFKVLASNLCTEIMLMSNEEHTFSCVLSSMNASLYDEWKDTSAVFDATVFLDCVNQDLIEIGKNVVGMEKVVNFAEKSRALGLGLLGFHSYLQDNMIPFESFEAHLKNVEIFKHLHDESLKASKWMAENFGEPEWCAGYGVRNTHRCVSGDTEILTSQGIIAIEKTIGKEIDIWNGYEWSTVIPFQTGNADMMLEITLSNGNKLKCTTDHIWKILTPIRSNSIVGGYKSVDVPTYKLRIGDCIPKTLGCVIDYDEQPDLPYAYDNGMFCGDGSISNSMSGKYPRNELRLYDDKVKCIPRLTFKSEPWDLKLDGILRGKRGYLMDDLLKKYEVPINYSLISRIEWLAGIIDSDGSVTSQGITISTANEGFAKDIIKLLLTLGCFGHITTCHRTCGYNTQNGVHYAINISIMEIATLKTLGLKLSRCIDNFKHSKNTINNIHSKLFVNIVDIKKLDGLHSSYCFTDKKRGTGIFNGILTGQCAVAPNLSSALICGSVSQGIEPIYKNAYIQNTAAGKMTRVNPSLLKIMKDKGIYSDGIVNDLIANNGSVQHVEWLTEQEKQVFKTAFEIDQKTIIKLASARQKYIDQAQSINLFFSADEDEEYIAEVHQIAFLDKYIKSLYYIRSETGVNVSKGECLSCHG